jgi:S-adenosyl methyltransferase
MDVGTPNVARIYDFWLGGTNNFEVDRQAAAALVKLIPSARTAGLANRAFLRRAVRYLAGEAGIRQFLDIGTGLPTQGNVHEIAQMVRPGARVVYADNDPVVRLHAKALLIADPDIEFVEADARRPEEILAAPETQALIDFSEPVGVLMTAVLHFVLDEDDPYGILTRLRDGIPAGSYLVISHGCDEGIDPATADSGTGVYRRSNMPIVSRNRDQVARFFEGFDLVDPGVVWVPEWKPECAAANGPDETADQPEASHFLGAVGRKR